MQYLLKPFRLLWRIWVILVFAILFLLGYPLFALFLTREKWFTHAFTLKRVIYYTTALLSGIFIRKIQESPFDKSRTYVIISNHTSYLDVILTYAFLPIYYHFIGKQELGKIPFFRILFSKTNILLDRSSRRSAQEAYNRAIADLKKGISVFLFPEGTIPHNAPNLRRFKNGAARMAIELQLPVLPITYLDHWHLFPEGDNRWKGGGPGINRIVIHPPIETYGRTSEDIESLNNQLFQITHDTLSQYKILPDSLGNPKTNSRKPA